MGDEPTTEADAELAARRAEVLAELADVGRDLDKVPKDLKARRLGLYRRGRELGLTYKALGEAAGRSEVGVILDVQKADKADAAAVKGG